MHNIVKSIVVVILSLSAVVATASSTKIGVVDMHVLLQDSPQAKQSAKKLEDLFSKRRDIILGKQKSLNKKYKNFERDKSISSSAQNTKTGRSLSRLGQELQLLQQEYQADYVAKEREEMQKFMKIVQGTINEFSKTNNYQLILTKQSTAFTADSIEITKQILKQLKSLK